MKDYLQCAFTTSISFLFLDPLIIAPVPLLNPFVSTYQQITKHFKFMVFMLPTLRALHHHWYLPLVKMTYTGPVTLFQYTTGWAIHDKTWVNNRA